LPVVQTLRIVWERHYERTAEGKATWRAGPDLSRAATAIESPYDTQARHSTKRDTVWTGYKVHVSETCDPDAARLITHVHTTVATTQDVSSTDNIHQGLKDKGLLPGTHLVDAGYIDGELLVQSQERYGVELLGPPRHNSTWQAREGGYDQSASRWIGSGSRPSVRKGRSRFGGAVMWPSPTTICG
jgi:transposase